MKLKTKARKTRDLIRQQPEFFFREVLACEPWGRQIDIARSVRDNFHTVAPSCHASGKDWAAGRIALWFSQAYGPLAKVITTAPTDRQVREVLWREIADAWKNAAIPIGGFLTTQRLEFAEQWFILGFTASDYDPTSAQGYHSPHMLIIYDEAVGISREVREGMEGNLAGGAVVRLLEIGNATDPTSEFAKSAQKKSTTTMPISAFDTPNFTGFDLKREDFGDKDKPSDQWEKKIAGRDMPAPYLIQPSWVARHVHEKGWKHPFVQSRVLGKFPSQGPDALLDASWIEAAQSRDLAKSKDRHTKILVCDVARRPGGDDTVIGLRRGHRYRTLERFEGQKTTYTAGRLTQLWRDLKVSEVRVDDDGVGGGVTDMLEENGVPVIPMRWGSRPTEEEESEQFLNARAQWHWHLRDLFEDGLIDIDPDDDELERQLTALKVLRWTRKGQMVMEDKDEYRKRVGRSPDDSDTLVMAFAPVNRHPTIQVF